LGPYMASTVGTAMASLLTVRCLTLPIDFWNSTNAFPNYWTCY
jgi:hypothetical protein